MLNRIVLIGRLTRDPELRSTASGVPVTTFTLAVDRQFKNAAGERETDFINIVVWRGQAETCATYLSKGKVAAVDGRLQIRTYEANDGTKRTVAEVVADSVRFLSPRENNGGGYNSGSYGSGGDGFSSNDGGEMMPLDEIPF